MAGYRYIPLNAPCYSHVASPGERLFCISIIDMNSCGHSSSYIWNALKRQRLGFNNCWPHHKEGKTVYLHYEGLKPEYQNKIKLTLLDGLDPEEWYLKKGRVNDILNRLEPFAWLTPEEEQFFDTITYPNGVKISKEELSKAREASRWLSVFIRLKKKKDLKKTGYLKANDLYEDATFLFKNKGIKLPTSYTKLRIKIKEYEEKGPVCCIDFRKQGNKNAAKIYAEDQIAVLRCLCSKGASYNCEQIAVTYNAIASAKGWDQISRRSVYNYLQEYFLYAKPGRDGSEAFRNKLSMQVRRKRPSEALSFWSLDGWTVELYYKKQVTNKKGHTVTTYTNRLTAVIVMDAVNDYPVGYAIGESESVELIQAAVKNAIDHCHDVLGDYYRPYQLQSDRFGIKSLTSFYGDIAEYFTPARVKNAKTKPIERYFLTLNRNYCQFYFGNSNWSGFGITSKKSSQPNIDVLNANKHNFPDKDGVISQINWIIGQEREKKQKAWLYAWSQMPQDDRLVMSRETYLYKFGHRNDRTKRLEAGCFNPVILGATREYDSFDLEFRKNPLQSWTVVYDEKDLDTILVMDELEKTRFLLQAIYKQPMALRDRQPGDFKELQKIDEFNKRVLEPHIIDTIRQDEEQVLNLLIQTPELEGWRASTLLTDSQGQHKQYLQHSSLIKTEEDLAAELELKQFQKSRKILIKQRLNDDKKKKKQEEASYEEYARSVIEIDKFK